MRLHACDSHRHADGVSGCCLVHFPPKLCDAFILPFRFRQTSRMKLAAAMAANADKRIAITMAVFIQSEADLLSCAGFGPLMEENRAQ